MAESLLRTVVIPIASEADAEATCRAILAEIGDERPQLHVVHVIETAGGAPDEASVEQREERAECIFEIVEATLADEPVTVETEILYGTDVADAVLEQARELDASAVAFTPRGASRWTKLLTGDVAQRLLSSADRPVVILPAPETHD
jgi:nucleotide-binding universal stress UspA family protein